MEAAMNVVSGKDTAFVSNPSALSYTPSRIASGKVKQVRFLDSEVAYWQTATQHYMVNGSSTNPPSAVNVHALDGTRWVAYSRHEIEPTRKSAAADAAADTLKLEQCHISADVRKGIERSRCMKQHHRAGICCNLLDCCTPLGSCVWH